jgi:hypothetical protein
LFLLGLGRVISVHTGKPNTSVLANFNFPKRTKDSVHQFALTDLASVGSLTSSSDDKSQEKKAQIGEWIANGCDRFVSFVNGIFTCVKLVDSF